MIQDIKKFIDDFFEKLDIKLNSTEVKEEEENIYFIIIKSDESGIIIWPHWKNLDAIQSLLTIFIWKLLKTKTKIHIEVNDYKKSLDEKLFNFIKSKIDYVKSSWKDIRLPFYSAYDRKKIHSYVAWLNDNLIYTKSEWESRERRLYICKKNAKITIDIDGDDI